MLTISTGTQVDEQQGWVRLNQAFNAADLMTPRHQWLELRDERSEDAVIRQAIRDNLDLIPVVRGGQVVGVMMHRHSKETLPLNQEWIISHDTSIPSLIRMFTHADKPAFFLLEGSALIGLVAPADLNKMPARIFVYHLVGELEITLAQVIRDRPMKQTDNLLDPLRPNRVKRVRDQIRDAQMNNIEVDPLQFLYLSDLKDIVIADSASYRKLGFETQAEAQQALNGLVDLRNCVMHTVRPLLNNPSAGMNTLEYLLDQAQHILHLCPRPE